mmetsp:Transcript_68192/g.197505  ORF Transcript_68192/g.197505 Transcript_68192/m.197505 type:complete len:798 (+) Transcript_68192:1-2394(+)
MADEADRIAADAEATAALTAGSTGVVASLAKDSSFAAPAAAPPAEPEADSAKVATKEGAKDGSAEGDAADDGDEVTLDKAGDGGAPAPAPPPPSGLADDKGSPPEPSGIAASPAKAAAANKTEEEAVMPDESALKAEVDKELAAEAAKEEEEEKAIPKESAEKEAKHDEDKEHASEGMSEEDNTERLQRAIADQTHSKALSEMLTKVRMDTYMIRNKLDIMEREISDGVTLEEPDPSESLVYPLSICIQCILWLTAQYFLVYTALAVWKVAVDFFDLGRHTTAELALQGACETVFHAPMLCVLFLGAQLRAGQISQGRRGPPLVAEMGMEVCVWSLVVQTLLVLALPGFAGKTVGRGEEDIESSVPENQAMAGLLTLIRYAAMVGLHIGYTVVCIMVILMDVRLLDVHPVDIWDDPTTAPTEYAPELSVAMRCTIGLTLLFFLMYLLHAIAYSIVQLMPGMGAFGLADSMHDDTPTAARHFVLRWEEYLRACTQAVGLAPMVCTLFMAARMRALELNPKDGRPQWWAEWSFYVCTAAIAGQVIATLLASAAGVNPEVNGGKELEELRCAEASGLERLAIAVRSVLSLVTYGAIATAVVAIVVMSEGREKMQPFSPTMLCVLGLAAMYFFVYMCLFISQTLAMLTFSFATTLTPERVESLLRTVHLWKLLEYTVKLCPMTAILCLGVRERALDLSAFQGSPQCWAQDAMYVITAAILLHVLVTLIGGTFSRGVGVDEAGSPTARRMKYRPGKLALETLRAVGFVMLYGSLAVVFASVLTIRPETAGCIERGFHPLVHA